VAESSFFLQLVPANKHNTTITKDALLIPIPLTPMLPKRDQEIQRNVKEQDQIVGENPRPTWGSGLAPMLAHEFNKC
jgi:hypothetical protein